jgi:two-component system, response regulator PdtaR
VANGATELGQTNKEGPVVLVVEDNTLVRALTVERFGDAGLIVMEADDAEWAISILESNAQFIQVVFSDIVLPGAIDGLALAIRVQESWPWMAVALTSGQIEPSDLPDGVRFFRKPISADYVVDQIRGMAV